MNVGIYLLSAQVSACMCTLKICVGGCANRRVERQRDVKGCGVVIAKTGESLA